MHRFHVRVIRPNRSDPQASLVYEWSGFASSGADAWRQAQKEARKVMDCPANVTLTSEFVRRNDPVLAF